MATFANSRARLIVLALVTAVTAALLMCIGGGVALAEEGAGLAAGASSTDVGNSPWAGGSFSNRLADLNRPGSASPLAATDEGDQPTPLPTSGNCGADGANVTYSLADDGTLTISGAGAMADYANASDSPFFGRSDIKRVVVTEGITRIGDLTFDGCEAFASVSLPDTLEAIGVGAFESCRALESISVPEGVTSIGARAFFGCSSLTSINIPAGVTAIEEGTFRECSALQAINIPESVTTIGEYAFAECFALESASLPDTLEAIGYYGFGGCIRLTDIRIPASMTAVNDGAFAECFSLASVEIPEGVKIIGEGAFYGCVSLRSISIPASVEAIGDYAFDYCPNATISVDPNNSVYDSRGGCNALIETASNALIAGTAYSSIPDTVAFIADEAFAEPDEIEEFFAELGLGGITYRKLTSISIPDGVVVIGENAFSGCASLATVSIPGSVKEIGSYAFYNCKSLQAFSIPVSITSIGYSAFSGVTAAVEFEGSKAQWDAIGGARSGVEPASYGAISVMFNTNGGSAIAMQLMKPGEKAVLPDPAPTKDWCEFVGWYADEALETPFDFNAQITEDTIAYAKWDAMCVITFDTRGGSAVEAQHTWPGGKAACPTDNPNKDGRTFAGWYADSGCETPFDFENTAIETDVTIYAKWKIDPVEYPDGAAYAKFDSGTGTLTFFRSDYEYTNNQTQAYVDDSGNQQTVTYYADIETTAYSMSNVVHYVPWWENGRRKITSVVFEDEIAPVSTATWFWEMEKLESITGIEKLDTSKVTDTCRMFGLAKTVPVEYIENMDVSKVRTFGGMFSNCYSLTELDLSKWDTSSATSMFDLFNGCRNLKSLNLSGWDTSHIGYMGGMFGGCRSMTSFDLSSFDTSSAVSMRAMFNNCVNLTDLDLSNFDTSHVTDMYYMFGYCTRLSKLDMSGLDTSNVTDMSYMFYNCESLTDINLLGLNTSSVKNMACMFRWCESLSKLDLSGFDTASVTRMDIMFGDCTNMADLNLSGFDTSSVTTMYAMFSNCEKLESLDVSSFNTEKVTDMGQMFSGCAELRELDLSGFDTAQVGNMNQLFFRCDNLVKLDISSFDMSKVSITKGMFNCQNLTAIRLGEKTKVAEDAELKANEWQLADLGDTSVRHETLLDYDGSRPGWYVQGYGDLSIDGVADAVYTGKAVRQSLDVAVGGRALVEGEGYRLTYAGNVNAGTATVRVVGKGVWGGSVSRQFTIAPKACKPTVTLAKAKYTYDGKLKTPAVAVKDGATTLKKGTDYTVAYAKGRVNVGSYKVTVTLKGNRTGSAAPTFRIVKAKNTLVAKAKSAKAIALGAAKLKKGAVKVARANAIVVSKAKGPVTYKLSAVAKAKFKKYFAVAAKTGQITAKKGLPKGAYSLKVTVTAAGNKNYLASPARAVTVKIAVK